MIEYHKKCLLCESEKIEPIEGYERHYLVKCKNCDFVFIRRIPTLQELNDYYEHYASAHYLSPITVMRYHKLLDEFEKYRKTGKILDVGCGIGLFLNIAKERGWEVYGTEFSADAIKICKEKGITMHGGILDSDNYEEEMFDVITSFEVIEHINNPLEETAHIQKILRKGGLFYCTTPNFNSLMRYYLKADYNVIEYPEHLSYYTSKTLTFLMNKFGFKKQKVLTTGISITRFKGSQDSKKEKESKEEPKKQEENEKVVGEALVKADSADEILRNKIESNPVLQLGKKVANGMLNITNTGLTLKGYYTKK